MGAGWLGLSAIAMLRALGHLAIVSIDLSAMAVLDFVNGSNTAEGLVPDRTRECDAALA